jgi:hypothetical protein
MGTGALSPGKAAGAQAVSLWLSTAAARVRSRVCSSGICGGQSGAGAGFLRVLRFPLAIFIPPIAPQSPSPVIWGWCNRPEVAAAIKKVIIRLNKSGQRLRALDYFYAFSKMAKLISG